MGQPHRRTTVLGPDQVVDDEVLHPGAVVWLVAAKLTAIERARFEATRRRCITPGAQRTPA